MLGRGEFGDFLLPPHCPQPLPLIRLRKHQLDLPFHFAVDEGLAPLLLQSLLCNLSCVFAGFESKFTGSTPIFFVIVDCGLAAATGILVSGGRRRYLVVGVG